MLADQPHAQNVGQPLTLARASDTNPGEDFTFEDDGTVSEFVEAGLIAPGMAALYGPLEVYEIQYAPYGAQSGLCVGVGTAPAERHPGCPRAVRGERQDHLDSRLRHHPDHDRRRARDQRRDRQQLLRPPSLTALAPGLPLSTSMLRVSDATLAINQLWGARWGPG